MSSASNGDTSPEAVTRKAMRGAVNLGIRQVLVQGSTLAGNVILARLLSPADFGIYIVILFLSNFLTAFSAAGLAASLIRQGQEPSEEDYRTVFTAQQIAVAFVIAVVFLLAAPMTRIYHLPPESAWLFRLASLSLLASSFMVVPQARLERHLAFDRLAMIEVPQALVFTISTVSLVLLHVGPISFAIALLLRTLTGAVLANFLSPWRIGFHWNWSTVKSHLRFSLPFQGIQLVSLIKDSVTPIFVGILLGPAQVGYLNWASMVAAYPVLVLFILQRLYMPAFSRLQGQPFALAQFMERVVWSTNAITAPLAIFTFVLIVPITHLIFGDKWLVAIPYFYCLWAANLFVPTSTPAISLLNALGFSQLSFNFAIVWMMGTWLIGAPLILIFGPIGFAIANLIIQFTNVFLFKVAQSKVNFKILRQIVRPWASAIFLGLLLWLVQRFFPIGGIATLVIYSATALSSYALALFIIDRPMMDRRFNRLED